MPEWFNTFFEGLAVDFWLTAAPPPTEDLDFVQSVFAAGAELLDVPCGAGRHAIPLAARGYRMTGVDISHGFLEHARAADPNVEWHERDMRELPWTARFDGVLCLGNSFGYLDRAGTRDFLASVARALKPGGAFVLDTTSAVAECTLPTLQERRWMQFGEMLFLIATKYNAQESRLDTEYTFLLGAQRETKAAHISVYTIAELRELVQSAGLSVEAMYGTTSREPFRLGSPRLILVGRR